ncbi:MULTISPECIES: heavy metal translocating P-type ATPase [Bradyrhizobium]|jgi:Cu+-exporting ATPase|uniref:Heavy metal translocating P-type ATPase n=6 Tax=Bradyrhizobium TaxID=374 RepID=A0ABS5G214_9BRAD|nr:MULTISPECIES: heavy metal translocating P-type ATPase [Bradyrhizobium]MBR1135265.1 heavy metal translocating P-type ATPase [Bradyrhizobium denitrificans]MDU1495675.1 heavy metal translocating P-type ATPase [Bradyrhizobium sp.]MDU1545821.1 heavy metal translocating P-type ATPase [Bradyrhizobium sp.]MDU1806585.1 heavy metal translocating P-type ATPase [Bradyrhizobium sp.]MDU3039838.1 heavy metal translocating P-type ATPase [Bradyrhizobium sp.]
MGKDGDAISGGGCGCSSKAPGPGVAASGPTPKAAGGCCGGGHDHSGHGGHVHHEHRAATTVRDPVCGMDVDSATSKHSLKYREKAYHFCSAGCRSKFEAAPEQYLGNTNEKAPAEVPAGTIYTCPMHPQIRQVGPGNCPICGMALEPEVASLDAPPNPELADMTRRFWVGLALSIPPVVLEMGGHLVGSHGWVDQTLSNWIQLVFSTPVVLWSGWPFFVRGWQSLVTRNLNMFTLIAMGTGVAYVYSLIGTVAPGIFPATFRGHGGAVAVYFEAAAVITVLVLLGQVLELRAREATSGAIKALLELAPKTARRIGDDGSDHEVQIESLAVGDRLRVRPGEKVPVDGVILEGRSSLDESLVTGESMPVTKEVGGKVIAGTLNQSGGFVMRADKVGRDTLLSQIVKMVAEAQRSRAPIQRLADQVAGWFVPAVIAVALIAFGTWAYFGPEPRMAFGLVAAVSVLIIACPCALGLATPMSIMVGVGRGAQAGVLIKNAEALERMEKIDTLVVDKTGTLTEGRPKVVSIVPAPGHDENELLRLAATVERASEHPLADAIVRSANDRKLVLSKVEEFDSPTGKGAVGKVEGKSILLGNANFLASLGVATQSLEAEGERMRGEGATVINMAVDGKLAGLFAIADPVKASTPAALKDLKAEGVKVIMLTGDNRTTAKAVARQLGIEDVEAEVLPDQKSAVVARLQKAGRIVAMAGDGVNDAPALAAAEVGIAMGTGTDVAMESAGVTLLKGDLGGIVRARKLSEATMSNIRQNLFFAFIYNAAGVPIAAGVLYPTFGILLSPIIAAAAMALSSVSVVGNALRLRVTKL